MGSLTLHPFDGQRLMVVRVEGPAGSLAMAHAHPHEQMCLVVSGRLRFRVGERELLLGAGDIVHIPPGVEHETQLLQDSVFFDVFTPVREDFLQRIEAARPSSDGDQDP